MRLALAAAFLAACGGSDGGADAPVVQSTLMVVTPCAGEAATVTAGAAYEPPATSVSQGAIVKFVMPSDHDVAPSTPLDDPGLMVGFGETKCLRFTTPGTYKFKCTAHGFTGTVTVN